MSGRGNRYAEKEELKISKPTFSFRELELVERLAELEHEQWTCWSKAIAPFLANTKENMERLQRWSEYWVPYSKLPEEVKDLDRRWAKKTLKILNIILES